MFKSGLDFLTIHDKLLEYSTEVDLLPSDDSDRSQDVTRSTIRQMCVIIGINK